MFDAEKLFKKRLRFTVKDDLTLFQLVKSYDPFQNKDKWNDIQRLMKKNTGKPFSLRTLRERVTHLVKRYVTEDLKYNKAHATPAQWMAKSKLLADIVNLRIQAVERTGGSKNSSSLADEAMENFDGNLMSPGPVQDYVLVKVESEPEPDDNHNDDPLDNDVYNNNEADDSFDEEDDKPLRPRKHAKLEKDHQKFATAPSTEPSTNRSIKQMNHIDSSAALDYLTNRHEEELNLKRKLLAVEEKKLTIKEGELAIEREKFELHKMERTQRLEMELKERELHMKVLEQQQQMIAMLLEQNRGH